MREGWTYKKLGEVCEILDSQRKPVTKKDRTKGIYPYYGASGIQDYVDSYIFDGRFLLVGEDGAKWGASDKSAFIIEGKSWVNNHAHILKISDSINDRLIEYYLTYKDLTEYISGAVVPKLTQKSLVSIPIPIPPIAEQERIVAELDLLSGIIEKKKEQLKAYDQLAQSIFYTMFGDPIYNPKGWEVKKLGKISTIGTGATPSREKEELYYGGDIHWVKTTEVHNCDITETEESITQLAIEQTNCKIYPPNTLLMAMYGQGKTRGQIAKLRINAATNQACAAILLDFNICNLDYVYELLLIEYEYIRAMAQGGNQANLNMKLVATIPIPVPPLSLQQEFAEKVEAIERQKALVQQSIEETQTMFDYTMDKYFG